jgi:protein O-mannosyl-transferase
VINWRTSDSIDVRTSAAAGSRRTLSPILAACAAMFGALLYLNTLNNPFTYDDYHLVVENPYIGSLSDIRSVMMRDITRPVVSLSYVIDTVVWGREPYGYHLTNILLHALNVALMFWVALLACEDRRRQRGQLLDGASSPALAASAAACLFAVHPMMTQAVGYISGRSEVLYCAIFLLAFLAGRQWILQGRKRWLFSCSILWAAGMLTKESAAMLPFVLMTYSWLVLDSSPDERRRRLLSLGVPLVALTVLAIASRLAVLRFVEYESVAIDGRFLLVAVDAFWHYLALFARPENQSIFHALPMPDSTFPLRTIAGVAGLLALPLAAWGLRRFHSVMAFGGMWFLMMLTPSSVLFALGIGEPLAEHRAYVSAAGLFLVWGAAFDLLWHRISGSAVLRVIVTVAALLFVAQLAMRTVDRNEVWGNPVQLAGDAVALAPHHWFPRLLLADAYRQSGRCKEAIPEYERVLALRPDNEKANINLASCLIREHRIDEAMTAMLRLEAINPASPDAVMTLGVLSALKNEPARAEAYFTTAIERHPSLGDARRMLAFVQGRLPAEDHRDLCTELGSMAQTFDVAACVERRRANDAIAP